MASSPPFSTQVKNGKVYHVYPHHKFRFIRNVGETTAQTHADQQGQALLDAIGLTGGDSKNILKAAQTMSNAKLQAALAPIDQAETNLAGQNSYLSQRMAKYGQIFQNAVNQTAQQAAAANVSPQLMQASGNAALDNALRNSIAARTQGYAANAATAAQVAPMRFADQQQQLAQQFQGQMAQLQQKRLQTQQASAGDYLSTLTDLGQKQIENQMASQALGLKTDIAQANATHQHNQDVTAAQNANTAAASVKERAQAAAAALTSQELRQKRQLDAAARQGTLNRQQKSRLAALDRKVKLALHNSQAGNGLSYMPQGQQNTVASKISSITNLTNKAKTQKKWTRQQAARVILKNNPGLDQTYLSAALDLTYLGYISNGTAAKLHARGIKVSALGGKPNPNNSAAAMTGGN